MENIQSLIDIMLGIFVLLIIISVFIGFFKILDWLSRDKKNSTPQDENKETDTENGEAEPTEEYPYIKTYLLSKNEWAFYKKLKPIADKYKIHILAKVRLADLTNVKKGLSNSKYYKAFGKIKAKHLDFVLANPNNLAVLAAIELDDKSHEEIDRQQRDFFIEKLCETIKLPLIRTNGQEDIETLICEKLKITKK